MSDYRIRPVTALAGAIKLKDELKVTFDLVGRAGGRHDRAARPRRRRRQHLPGRRRLRRRGRPAARAAALPEGARVVDFGIRGLDLTYALLDGYEAVILVDAAPRGGPPGTLYVLEPDPGRSPGRRPAARFVEAHNLDPAKVLRLAAALGGRVGRAARGRLRARDPADAGRRFEAGLSEPVRAAVDEAVPLVESLVARLLRGEDVAAGGDVMIPREGGRTMSSLISEIEVRGCADEWRHQLDVADATAARCRPQAA